MGDYNRNMYNDPRYLEMMRQRELARMMQQQEAMRVPDYQLETPSLTPNSLQNINTTSSPALTANTNTPAAGAGGGWGGYVGMGASAAAPVAAALLSKQGRGLGPPPAVSVGGKPIMQINPEIYPQQQRMPAFLARLLMGAK